MKKAMLFLPLCACATFLFAADAKTSSAAFEQKYANATDDQISEAFNALSAEALVDGRNLAERRQALDAAASDPNITSPSIEAARNKLAELEREVLKARQALREALEQQPEVKARRMELERDTQKHTDAIAEIAYLRKRLIEIRTRVKP